MAETLDVAVHELTPDEARELLDGLAQHYLGMSGAEFVRALDAGEITPSRDCPDVIRVAMLAQLGRQESR